MSKPTFAGIPNTIVNNTPLDATPLQSNFVAVNNWIQAFLLSSTDSAEISSQAILARHHRPQRDVIKFTGSDIVPPFAAATSYTLLNWTVPLTFNNASIMQFLQLQIDGFPNVNQWNHLLTFTIERDTTNAFLAPVTVASNTATDDIQFLTFHSYGQNNSQAQAVPIQIFDKNVPLSGGLAYYRLKFKSNLAQVNANYDYKFIPSRSNVIYDVTNGNIS